MNKTILSKQHRSPGKNEKTGALQIPISRTLFGEKEFENILKPLQSGWVVQGPYVKEFEEKWCKFTGSSFSVATSNCTTAIHLVLSALNIGTGDEVIIPSFTWIATANAVELTRATPVFCDIELDTFNIDNSKIKKLVTGKTKAIIPVHLFGMPAEIDEINKIAANHNLYVIEDAACAFGTKYRGKHAGTFGTAGCFSFHPRKAITTGEGGMVTTGDKGLAFKLRSMRDHGSRISDYERDHGKKPYLLPDFPYCGYNYRMTDIQGAIGSSQMDNAEEILNKRKKIARKYDELFDSIEWLQRPQCKPENEHGYQAYVSLFQPEEVSIDNVNVINRKRNSFMEYMQQNGISTRPGTHAVHRLDYYSKKYNFKPQSFPNSWIADQCSISFPLYPTLSDEEFEYIANKIRDYDLA